MNLEDNTSGGLGAETIYGTHEDARVVMSEKVKNLAGSIYMEFERMIARYDEDVVKTLMPLLVNVLECLDAAYQSNQEHDVELELLREDNEQLVTQYEREKGARKQAEQKLLEYEDIAEAERKELSGRLEALESIVRMLELKHKNSLEHASRLEERENELKKEYAKLHDRYTELFKNHVDYMERTKLLLGAAGDRTDNRARVGLNPMSRSSGPISFGFSCLEGGVSIEHAESMGGTPISESPSPPTPPIGDELAAVQTMERAHQTDPVTQHNQATSPVTPQSNAAAPGRSQTKREKRSGNTLYQELSFHDADSNLNEGDEGGDITGSWVHPGEYASSVNDNYFGMGREVENLILENNELLATKNALNIVKDDLIVRVDELTGEQEILREEVASLSLSRQKLRDQVAELEEELKKIREEGANKSTQEGNENEEADVPMAQRKKFTRVEMARVLMERNQYKERFIELQEAVRFTEMMRANKTDSIEKKQSIWNFFNKLFSSNERPQRPLSTQLKPTSSPAKLRHSKTHSDFLETSPHHSTTSDIAQQRKKNERRDQYRQVRAHVRKEDGRMQAYGWSLPSRTNKTPTPPTTTSSNSSVPVPVPVFCRPLTETNPGMKFWCGAGVNLSGSTSATTNAITTIAMIEAPKGSGPSSLADEMKGALEAERQLSQNNAENNNHKLFWAQSQQTHLSSYVWICSSTHSNSTVTVIDANNPADLLATFSVCNNHLLCISSVAGYSISDYDDVNDNNTNIRDVNSEQQSNAAALTALCALNNNNNANTTEPPPGAVTLISVGEEIMSPSDSKVVEDTLSQHSNNQGEVLDDQNNEDDPPLTDPPELAQEKEVQEKPTTAMSTMWLGAQGGMLYLHSAVRNWHVCLGKVQLKDAVLSIVQCKSRVVVALADGTVGVFGRTSTGEWDLSRYHLLTLGGPQHSVRCLVNVEDTVWCGHRSKVHIVEPKSLRLIHSLEAHPRRESQVRQLAHLGDGVWVSIRLDSTLRLYHARTYQHLQDVDIEPYVSKMLGAGKLGFSFVRITALLISAGRLWIGTGNGVIISVPLSDSGAVPNTTPNKSCQSGGLVPYCSMAHAQLSFHGHREAVKFFVAVPGSPGNTESPAPMLVMSAGEGYIDFRIGDGDMEDSVVMPEGETIENAEGGSNKNLDAKVEKSHLIVWQVSPP